MSVCNKFDVQARQKIDYQNVWWMRFFVCMTYTARVRNGTLYGNVENYRNSSCLKIDNNKSW